MISGLIEGNSEQALCPQDAGNLEEFSITCPFFSGKDAMKKPSQKVSCWISFFPSRFNLDKYSS